MKPKFLLQAWLLVLLTFVVTTLISCQDSKTALAKKKDTIITIYRGNTANGTLIMSDSGFSVDVDYFKDVIWTVDSAANISLVNIYKKDASTDIFFSKLKGNEKRFSGTVKFALGKIYDYNISWRKNGDTTLYIYDPKISVKPTIFPLDFGWLITILIGLSVLVFGIRFAKKRQTNKQASKNIS